MAAHRPTKRVSRSRVSGDGAGAPRRHLRKTLQLCRQVAETIDGVLASSDDDLIRDLQVLSVEPAPDASRLLVTVRPIAPGADYAVIPVLGRLTEFAGEIRSEVAGAITRRKCPNLAFQVTLDPLS